MTKAEIQLVRALADKRTRTETGLFVAEGRKLVEEICASPLRVRKIFTTETCFTEGEVEHLAPRDMERLSHLKTASSTVALVELPRYALRDVDPALELVLALDDVRNPGNLGTIIRLADWFGIRHVVCSAESADCFNPKVVQATMGAILRCEVHYTDLAQWLGRHADVPCYGTFLDGENIYEADLTPTGIVVMGNEGHGISDAVAGQISRRLFIPPWPVTRHGSESLNVAMATAVICNEFRRRMPR